MDQTLDTRQQTAAPPRRAEERVPDRAREPAHTGLTPVLQAVRAGLPARDLPPATLAELAEYLGNSAMEALLEAESPGPDLTRPRLGPRADGPAREIDPGRPDLAGPPDFSGLTPLTGPGGDPAALGASGGGAAWPVMEGGGAPWTR